MAALNRLLDQSISWY